MKRIVTVLVISILLAVVVYTSISAIITLGVIYTKDLTCHYNGLISLLQRPATWASFGFISGMIWSELPYQISSKIFNFEVSSDKIRYLSKITLGMSGLILWQILPAHDFAKCMSTVQ